MNLSLLEPYPILKSPPVINADRTSNEFKCSIQYPSDIGAIFKVTWVINNNVIGHENLTSSQRTSSILIDSIRGNIGHSLYCKCESFFAATPNIKSGTFTSKGFFCGIKVNPPILNLKNKIEQFGVVLSSTFPVRCTNANALRLQPDVTSHDITFLYLDQRLSWKSARTECLSQGYDIASLDTTDKWNRAIQYIQSVSSSTVPVWIGLIYNDTKTRFHWMNGEDATYSTPWDQNEPDSLLVDHCVYLNYDNNLYSNTDCSLPFAALCSKSVDQASRCSQHLLHKLPFDNQLLQITTGKLKANTTKLVWFTSSDDCPLVNGYRFGPIQVYPQTLSVTKICMISNTEATTFDNFRYALSSAFGEYTLLITREGEKIQGRFWFCREGLCLCSVSVQYTDEAISFDGCNSLQGEENNVGLTMSRVHGSNAAGISVTVDSDTSYTIYLPTGLSIQVTKASNNDSDNSIKILISVSSSHKFATFGLCGTYDDNAPNDLRGRDHKLYAETDYLKFIETWKIPDRQSVFDHDPRFHGEKKIFEKCECDSSTNSLLC